MIVPLEVIEPIVHDEKSTWSEKFKKIVAYKRSCGLRGFHATFYREDGNEVDAEKAAHDICMMEPSMSRGDFESLEEPL